MVELLLTVVVAGSGWLLYLYKGYLGLRKARLEIENREERI